MFFRNSTIENRSCPATSARASKRLLGNRKGTATVEAAIALPVLLILVFGSMEVANGIFLEQSLTVAAYEGARSASSAGGTVAEAQQRIQDVLQSRGVTGQTVTVVPAVTAATARGTLVTVTVSVPGAQQALNPLRLLQGETFTQSVVMVRL